jgi:hypothetical protein
MLMVKDIDRFVEGRFEQVGAMDTADRRCHWVHDGILCGPVLVDAEMGRSSVETGTDVDRNNEALPVTRRQLGKRYERVSVIRKTRSDLREARA